MRMFWEVDATKLDTETRPEYIMERILEYGTLEGVIWSRRTIGDEKIVDFITGLGRRRLSTRTLNFWQKILKVPEHKCMTISSMKKQKSVLELLSKSNIVGSFYLAGDAEVYGFSVTLNPMKCPPCMNHSNGKRSQTSSSRNWSN